MNNTQTNFNLCKRIIKLRKEKGYTQETLANQLGVTYQAVSKWENELSYPDITLIPIIADIFDVSLDDLFGRMYSLKNTIDEENSENTNSNSKLIQDRNCNVLLPWEEDDTLRVVLFRGRDYISSKENLDLSRIDKLRFVYEGDALNIKSDLSVECNHCNIEGDVSAGAHITCTDIGGNAKAGAHITCSDIGGSVVAGSHINCSDVGGDVNAGSSINCSDISGNVQAGSNIRCSDIKGHVTCYGSIQYE